MSLISALPPQLFYLVMAIVGIGWFAILVFPNRSWANYWVAGVVIPSILGIIYTALMIVYWFQPPPGSVLNFFSLTGAYSMFGNKGLLLAAWTDIILLSLVAGAWITRKATQIRMPNALLRVLLLIAFGFPGTGLVLFFIACAVVGRWRTLEQLESTAPVQTVSG
jgi:hypothetical protein